MSDNPRVFGKYDVIRRIAVGGMGEIFMARQTGMAGFERLAILKSLLPQLASEPDQLAQFLDEARIVGSINHPNVVACFEVGEWEGVYFLAMEYINGVDIAQLQKAADDAGMRFPIHAACAIVREAALGLDSAHHAHDAQSRPLKIVHRDISPHNIMVRQDGLSKIVDFGVAIASNRQVRRTEGGMLKGKLGYMAPEQIKARPLDGRADQFSLGVLLWELVCGRRLFTAEDPSAVFMKIIREKVPPPSSIMKDVPPELDAIILKMTAQEPEDRYNRLSEVAAALRKFLDARGALENETADLVRELVGAQLAERVRDLTPSAVRILGVNAKNEAPQSTGTCGACNANLVQGDRFCRSCGTPVGQRKTPPNPTAHLEPDVEDSLSAAADQIDVAFDDQSQTGESAVCIGEFAFVDEAGSDRAPENLTKPLIAHLQELAHRLSQGKLVDNGDDFTVHFEGASRASRMALAFARRAQSMVSRAHRKLRLRLLVTASTGSSQDDLARDARELLARAPRGRHLVTDTAMQLASVSHQLSSVVDVTVAAGVRHCYDIPAYPRIVGRSAERLHIENAIAHADFGKPQQLLLVGDGGLGKSTMLLAADADARDRGFVVALGRGVETMQRPYHLIKQLVKSACTNVMADPTKKRPWHEALEPLGIKNSDRERLIAFVDNLAFSGPSGQNHDGVPLSRRRLLFRASLLSFFTQLSTRRGLCVLIDDVDIADSQSLDLIAEFSARIQSTRYVLVATGRPHRGERVLPLAKRVVLEPMEKRELMAVASSTIGAQLSDADAERIAQAAQGSPLYVAIVVRVLLRCHLLKIIGTDVIGSDDIARYPFPPSVPVALFVQHALVSPAARQLLGQLASATEPSTMNDVQSIAGADKLQAMQALTESLAAAACIDVGNGRFTFATRTELEITRARVPIAQRQAFTLYFLGQNRPNIDDNERRAIFLSAEHSPPIALIEAARLHTTHAEHYARLGAADAVVANAARCAKLLWRAASHLSSSERDADIALTLVAKAASLITEFDPVAASDLLTPLLRRLKNASESARSEALFVRATALLKQRRTDDARELLEQVIASANGEKRAIVMSELGQAYDLSGKPNEGREMLAQAIAALPDSEVRRRIDARISLCKSHLRTGEIERAKEIAQQALADATASNDVALLIDTQSVVSTVHAAEKNVDLALAALLKALAAANQLDDVAAEARVRHQQARTLQQSQRVGDALIAARQAHVVAQRIYWDEGASVAQQMVQSLEARV